MKMVPGTSRGLFHTSVEVGIGDVAVISIGERLYIITSAGEDIMQEKIL